MIVDDHCKPTQSQAYRTLQVMSQGLYMYLDVVLNSALLYS